MAGTPTPNYQFPTYAETDTPNLAGAYNQAVNAIDAKIKEVADTIPSGADVPDATSTTKGIAKLYDSTTVGAGDQDDGGITPKAVDDKIGGSLTGYAPKFTVAAPITYSENQIGIRYSNPAADGAQNGYGAVQVTGKQSDVAEADSLTTATVPNVKAVKDYVDAKVPTEQQAYTGTAPIIVDNRQKLISIPRQRELNYQNVDEYITKLSEDATNATAYTGAAYPTVTDATAADTLISANDEEHAWAGGRALPTLALTAVMISNATPNASTSTKGLVQLTTSPASADSTMAVTGSGVVRLLSDRKTNATTNVTVDMLKNLYVDTSTGVVYYKALSE